MEKKVQVCAFNQDGSRGAAIERAMGRLIAEGTVHQTVSRRDGRRRELKLDTIAARRLGRYHTALQRSFDVYEEEAA